MKATSKKERPAACRAHYEKLHAETKNVLEASFNAQCALLQSESHAALADFVTWYEVLDSRLECSLFGVALREYQFGLLALVQGFYRLAFMALRLFLELSLGAVHLSANELQLRLLLDGKRDLNWRAVIDGGESVFSADFVQTFYLELKDEAPHYRNLANNLYRECSEYVHGDPQLQDTFPQTLAFSETLFREWHLKAETARRVFHFALSMRYLQSLPPEKWKNLETPLMDELGNLQAIRSFFNKERGR